MGGSSSLSAEVVEQNEECLSILAKAVVADQSDAPTEKVRAGNTPTVSPQKTAGTAIMSGLARPGAAV